MATKTWTLNVSGHHGDYKHNQGYSATYSISGTTNATSADYTLNSITFSATKINIYPTQSRCSIQIESSSGTVFGKTSGLPTGDGQNISVTLNNISSSILDYSNSNATFMVRFIHSNGSGNCGNIRDSCVITITCNITENKTKVSNPASISTTRKKNSINISWPAGSGGTNTTVSGYKVIRNTSKSETGATTVVSSTTSRSISHNPGNTTAYYYGVKSLCSNSAYNADGYTWTSSTIKLIDRPSVNQWSKITKSQMDSLQTWINDDAPNITQFAVIKSSAVTKYKSATQFAKINASWYNTD